MSSVCPHPRCAAVAANRHCCNQVSCNGCDIKLTEAETAWSLRYVAALPISYRWQAAVHVFSRMWQQLAYTGTELSLAWSLKHDQIILLYIQTTSGAYFGC